MATIEYTQDFDSFTIAASGSWTSYDIETNKGVPVGAVVEIVIAHSYQTDERLVGVRGGAETGLTTRYIDVAEGETSETGTSYICAMMPAVVDGDGTIDCYAETAGETTFYIMGWWTGITFTEMQQTYGLATGNWVNVTYNASYGIPKGAVCYVYVGHNRTGAGLTRGIREDGSSVDRSDFIHEAEDGGYDGMTMVVKTDTTNGQVEEFVSSGGEGWAWSMILGYFDSQMDFVEDFQQITTGTNDTWTDNDLSAYLDQDGRWTMFWVAHNNNDWARYWGVRENGVTDDRRIYCHESEDSRSTGYGVTCGTDGSGIMEVYFDDNTKDWVYFTGYYIPTPKIVGAGGSVGQLMEAMGML
ncbi:MAG: hypothetical protein ACYTFW_02635 [Planctomycetota bacterium]|jgi:hypothetical protein